MLLRSKKKCFLIKERHEDLWIENDLYKGKACICSTQILVLLVTNTCEKPKPTNPYEMKLYLSFLFYACIPILLQAQNTDLPDPSANLQAIPPGSYVIAMDNTLQVNSAGDFNLKAYGLLVYLLNNNAKMKWSIRAGKSKDGIDFTANAEQIKPNLIAGGVSRDFKAGPFVIYASDTTGICALVDNFYASNSLAGANRPQLYRLTATANNVDIRYDLTGFRPKAAILTDGGNQNIHVAYMTTCAIPSESYATSAGTDLLSNCFTFASEPHNTNSGAAVNNAISAIKDFVSKGGNFLAQCEAVNNYENNSLGRFQTSSGITISNANIGTTLFYPNPDLSFCQFEGVYNASLGGSLKNWKIVGTTVNNEHNFATGTGANSGSIGASVSKYLYGKGSLVFYLGNHSFAATSLAGINGIRMYMNAFLTPSNTNCPVLNNIPLGVNLIKFSGSIQNRTVRLNWEVSENETARRFEVEQGIDGRNFLPFGSIEGTNKNGKEGYFFSRLPTAAGLYYRLKIVHRNGRESYSPLLLLKGEESDDHYPLFLFTNPVYNELKFRFKTKQRTTLIINLYNSLGSKTFSSKINCMEGVHVFTIPSAYLPVKGSYIVEVIDQSLQYRAKLSKG